MIKMGILGFPIGYLNCVWFSSIFEVQIKELIKVHGKQVAPAELESILLNHPMVDDACVIGNF